MKQDDTHKRIVVTMVIAKDGSLKELKLTTPSGSEAADKAALEAVKKASPFRALPEGASETVNIQYTFDANVFRGGTQNKHF